MIKRLFVAAPLFLGAVYVVGCILTHGDETFIYGSVAAAKLLGGLGLMLAAVRYGHREYLFWAWALVSADMSLLGVTELLFTRRFNLAHLAPHTAELAWATAVVLANIFAAAGTLMLAHVWRAVGLALPDPSGAKRLVTVGGMLVATAVVLYVTLPALTGVFAHDARSIVIVVGAASDLVCFSVITPLALRALALRGGTLAWPWGLIAGCYVSWMIYDVVGMVTLPLSHATADAVVNGWRIVACLFGMAAGLAQRWAIRASAARD